MPRRLESAQPSAEELFRATFEQAAVGLAHVAPDGSWLRVNRRLCDILGYTRDELLARTFRDVTHPADLDVGAPELARLLAGEIESFSCERRYIQKGGSTIWGHVTISSVRAADGSPLYNIVVVEDISARKRAEDALGEREAHARAILDAAFDAIITMDHTGRVVEWNAAAERVFGYGRADAVGRRVRDLIVPPHLMDAHTAGLERYLTTGEARVLGDRYETVARRRSGEEFPVELSLARLNTEGPPVFTAYVRDTTEQRRAEEARAHLAAIVESTDDAILSKTLDGTITSWNRGAEQLYGYAAAEAVGRSISMIVPQDRPDELPGIMERIARGERVDHFETVRVRKDGTLVDVSLTVSPVQDAAGRVTGASAIARDITARKRAEAERERLLREEHRQREWAEAMSRELEATNLELVRLAAEAEAARRLEGQLAEARLQTLRAQLNPHFLCNALNTVAMLARRNATRDAVRAVAGIGELLRQALGGAPEITLREELAFVEQYLEIERLRFRRRLTICVSASRTVLDALVPSLILQPIVENAVRHGIARRAGTGYVEVTARGTRGRLHLEVRDNGPGFPEGWDPRSSAGVGLANTRARLQQTYGRAHRLAIGKARGGGALVVIEFPLRMAPAARTPGAASGTRSARSN